MGIKGFYGYCQREIPESFKTINILEEIEKYKSKHQKSPLIIINLSTLSYHFKLQSKDLLCGYQLNKIKYELEQFLSALAAAGAELQFVFKKSVADEEEFMKRRLRDYQTGCELLKKIEKIKDFEELQKIYKHGKKFPYNPLILVCLLQSAEKFGKVHGCNALKGKPTVQQTELARQTGAAWIMGLDTFYFILPGPWKIWCDAELNMQAMTIRELDPNVVMAHFNLKPEHAPLFACLIGDLHSISRITSKVNQHFGMKSVFPNAAKFINRLKSTSSLEMINEAIGLIFCEKFESCINVVREDFKTSLGRFEINEAPECKVDIKILDMVKDDFMNISEEILLNQPIFINPAFLDLRKKDMKPINSLVQLMLQKTTGILLKNIEDKEPRSLMVLDRHNGDFIYQKLEPIFPQFEFNVPSLEELLAGGVSTLHKHQMMFWIADLEIADVNIKEIPEGYLIDVIILLYLIKHKSLTQIEGRCILTTLAQARSSDVPLEISCEYPEKVNARALRASFVYLKIYFMFHSCLAALGMKDLCPEILFDGVVFQKYYQINVSEEEQAEAAQATIPKEAEADEGIEDTDKEANVEKGADSQNEIVDNFIQTINHFRP